MGKAPLAALQTVWFILVFVASWLLVDKHLYLGALLWGCSSVMVSYCHPWPAEEATSEPSDAGAPFTSVFLMASVNGMSSGPPCGTLPSGEVFALM